MMTDSGVRMRGARTAALQRRAIGIAFSFLLLFTAGCAEKGPILIEGIEYRVPDGMTPAAGTVTVAVSAFRDLRSVKPEVIGQRQIRDYVANELVVPGTAAAVVRDALGDALKARGISGKGAAAWDLNEGSIRAEGADILLGGEIKALSVDVQSQPLKVKYRAAVQLRVAAADVKERRIFRTLNLTSSVERESIGYSDFTVRELLGDALSAAINQLLNDEEIKKRIH